MPTCKRCGAEWREGARFCEQCGLQVGQPVTGRPPAPPLPTPTGTFRSISDYLKEAWDLFRQYPGGFVGFSGIILGIGLILSLFLMLIGVWTGSIALILLLAVILGALFFPLFAGFFTVPALLAQDQQPQFGDFFVGYQHFLQLFLLGLVASLFVLFGLMFFGPVGAYLALSYLLAIPLVVDRRLSFWSAMEASRRAVWRFFFPILALVLVLYALMTVWVFCIYFSLIPLMGSMGGMAYARYSTFPLAGGVLSGVFLVLNVILAIATSLVTYPLTFCALTLLYRDLFGIETTAFRAPHQPPYSPGWTPPPPPGQTPWQPPPGQSAT